MSAIEQLLAGFQSKQMDAENPRSLNKLPIGELIQIDSFTHAKSQYLKDNKVVYVLVAHYKLHGFRFATYLANAYENFIEDVVKQNAALLNKSIAEGNGLNLCYYGTMNKRYISRLHPDGTGTNHILTSFVYYQKLIMYVTLIIYFPEVDKTLLKLVADMNEVDNNCTPPTSPMKRPHPSDNNDSPKASPAKKQK